MGVGRYDNMEYHVSLPVSSEVLKKLRVNDVLYVTGKIFTARDSAHMKMRGMKPEDLPFDPSAMGLYHCGPLMKKENGGWIAVSAGPTTSSRMEEFEDILLDRFGFHLIIGKGGMGERTGKALKKTGSVYAVFTGGAGVLAAEKITHVSQVYWLEEFGMPEAVWILEVREFGPLVVAMDSFGQSLYKHA
jgi:tartrate/fumarate subfamily iron-sulfur-dependent hydro-lyase beta chain